MESIIHTICMQKIIEKATGFKITGKFKSRSTLPHFTSALEAYFSPPNAHAQQKSS
jgi:hypothetical protein